MDAYQFQDLILTGAIGAMESMTIYISVVSAYLAVAYLAGAKLTRSQAIIISSLFCVFALFVSIGTFSMFSDIASIHGTYGTGNGINIGGGIIFGAEIAGILASLKFMLDIRKNLK